MNYKQILARINELARKAREEGLTPEEIKERDEMRQAYLKLFREGFNQQLMGIKIVDADGNDVTPKKLKDAQKNYRQKSGE